MGPWATRRSNVGRCHLRTGRSGSTEGEPRVTQDRGQVTTEAPPRDAGHEIRGQACGLTHRGAHHKIGVRS